jgi:hypothetical protein
MLVAVCLSALQQISLYASVDRWVAGSNPAWEPMKPTVQADFEFQDIERRLGTEMRYIAE